TACDATIPFNPAETVNLAAETRAQELQELHDTLVKELHHTQEVHKHHADPKRLPGPEFHVGNKVWL
ncbi:hypothetical protein HDU83_000286, partial [Entophlyctis luteolus]